MVRIGYWNKLSKHMRLKILKVATEVNIYRFI
jgi:hypothetical protein